MKCKRWGDLLSSESARNGGVIGRLLRKLITQAKNNAVVKLFGALTRGLIIVIMVEFEIDVEVAEHFPVYTDLAILSNSAFVGETEKDVLFDVDGQIGLAKTKKIEV